MPIRKKGGPTLGKSPTAKETPVATRPRIGGYAPFNTPKQTHEKIYPFSLLGANLEEAPPQGGFLEGLAPLHQAGKTHTPKIKDSCESTASYIFLHYFYWGQARSQGHNKTKIKILSRKE